MNRTILNAPQGQDLVRETVRIEGDPSPADFASLWALLNAVSVTPTLLRHSTDCPEEVRVRHNGTAWVVETYATTAVRYDGTPANRSA